MENTEQRCVMVCQHSSCCACGAARVLFEFQVADLPSDVAVIATGCQGQCSSGPTVRIVPEETWYCRVQPSDVPVIVEQHFKRGEPVQGKLHPRIHQQWYV